MIPTSQSQAISMLCSTLAMLAGCAAVKAVPEQGPQAALVAVSAAADPRGAKLELQLEVRAPEWLSLQYADVQISLDGRPFIGCSAAVSAVAQGNAGRVALEIILPPRILRSALKLVPGSATVSVRGQIFAAGLLGLIALPLEGQLPASLEAWAPLWEAAPVEEYAD